MADTVDNRGPRERAYDEHFEPLVSKLIALSKEYGIPMVASWELDKDEDGNELLCTTAILTDGTCERLVRAKDAIYPPPPHFVAMTVTGGRNE